MLISLYMVLLLLTCFHDVVKKVILIPLNRWENSVVCKLGSGWTFFPFSLPPTFLSLPFLSFLSFPLFPSYLLASLISLLPIFFFFLLSSFPPFLLFSFSLLPFLPECCWPEVVRVNILALFPNLQRKAFSLSLSSMILALRVFFF